MATILICLSGHWSFSQWSLEANIQKKGVVQAVADALGNYYLVNENGDVAKYNSRGIFISEFSPSSPGQLEKIDITSQMRVLLFYKNLQEFVFINRLLTNPIRYRMREFNSGFITELIATNQQNLWMVDRSDFMLKLLDLRNNHIIEEKSLAKLLRQGSADELLTSTDGNRLYLYDEESGVLVFDNLGNYIATIDVEINARKVAMYKNLLYAHEQQELLVQDLVSGKKVGLNLPKKDFHKIVLIEDHVLLIDTSGVMIYKYLSGDFFSTR